MQAPLIVADDDADAVALITSLARQAGWDDVRVATTGTEALRQWRSARDDGPVDAVLLDVRLPDVSGVEVARTILGERPGTTVVLISGVLDEPTTAVARQLGVQACIAKNELSELPTMLQAWLDGGNGAAT